MSIVIIKKKYIYIHTSNRQLLSLRSNKCNIEHFRTSVSHCYTSQPTTTSDTFFLTHKAFRVGDQVAATIRNRKWFVCTVNRPKRVSLNDRSPADVACHSRALCHEQKRRRSLKLYPLVPSIHLSTSFSPPPSLHLLHSTTKGSTQKRPKDEETGKQVDR